MPFLHTQNQIKLPKCSAAAQQPLPHQDETIEAMASHSLPRRKEII